MPNADGNLENDTSTVNAEIHPPFSWWSKEAEKTHTALTIASGKHEGDLWHLCLREPHLWALCLCNEGLSRPLSSGANLWYIRRGFRIFELKGWSSLPRGLWLFIPGQSILELSYSCVSIRMHTRVHGGLCIYLHKMPGKHPGYGQMLSGEEFG